MVKIYTKTGDKGSTSLFGGTRIDKDSKRLAAYGTVDELNSQIGVVLAEISHSHEESQNIIRTDSSVKPQNDSYKDVIKKLRRIQDELFILGWDLSSPLELKSKRMRVKRITKTYTLRLEKEIDVWTKELPEIKYFILPGGGKVGGGLHLARTIVRRAERETVALSKEELINKNAIIYLNRLSDWLFTLARYANHLEKISEVYWRRR